MAPSDFSPDVERFIRDHISAVEQLEILLLLWEHAPRPWSAVRASRELRIDPVSAGRRMTDFNERGLLKVRAGEEALEYWYERGISPGQDRIIGELARLYRDRRTSLIQLIFSAPVSDVRVFADAFRLRKNTED